MTLTTPRRGSSLRAATLAEMLRQLRRNTPLSSAGSSQVSGVNGTIIDLSKDQALGSNRPKWSQNLFEFSALVGEPVAFQLSASPFVVEYAVAARTPITPGLSLDPVTGIISGATLTEGLTEWVVSSRNSRGRRSATVRINSSMPFVPFVADQAAEGQVGEVFSYQLLYDHNAFAGVPRTFGGVPAWQIAGLPLGLSLDPETGLISGLPLADANATALNVTCSNAAGHASIPPDRLPVFTITIKPAEPPRIISASSIGSNVITAIQYDFLAHVPISDLISLTPLADGLALTVSGPDLNKKAQLTGTVPTNGVYVMQFQAVAPQGSGPIFTLTLSVSTVTPQIFVGSPPAWDLKNGTWIADMLLNASNPPIQSWEIDGGSPQLTLLAHTPPIADQRKLHINIAATGIFTTQVRASNHIGWGDWKTVAVTAVDSRAPVLTTPATGSGNVALRKTLTITVSDTTTPLPHEWSASVISGTSGGVTVSTASGVLTIDPRIAGDYIISISATNTHGTGYKTYELSVGPANLSLNSSDMNITCGTAASKTLSCSGGGPVDGWSVSGLPSGLSCSSSGVISGTHSYEPGRSYPATWSCPVSVSVGGVSYPLGNLTVQAQTGSVSGSIIASGSTSWSEASYGLASACYSSNAGTNSGGYNYRDIYLKFNISESASRSITFIGTCTGVTVSDSSQFYSYSRSGNSVTFRMKRLVAAIVGYNAHIEGDGRHYAPVVRFSGNNSHSVNLTVSGYTAAGPYSQTITLQQTLTGQTSGQDVVIESAGILLGKYEIMKTIGWDSAAIQT